MKEVLAPVEQKLKQINKPGLKVVVNYDNCTLEEEALHYYSGYFIIVSSLVFSLDSVKELIETYQYTVIRYSTNAFLRMKFGNELIKRNLKPHLFENANQAVNFLKKKEESKSSKL